MKKNPKAYKDFGQSKTILIGTIGLILSAGIFLTDLWTPLGIADGISYVALVLLTIWIPQKKYVYIAASTGILLVILGFIFSPKGENMDIVIPNRALAILGIIAAATILLSYKRTQELASKTKEQLEALFLHANEGILILDASGQILLANPKSAHLFSYKKTELSGKKIYEIIPAFPETGFKPASKSTSVKDSGDLKQTGTGHKKDNTLFPVEFSFSQYQTSEGVFTVVFVMDITRRKRDEEALLKIHRDLEISMHELKRSNSELENFAYVSSHDLQEPLRKIQSFGHRLKQIEGDNLGEQSTDYLNRMLNAASRMQNLINDLLLFSRVTSRRQSFSQVNLKQILEQVMTDTEVTIEQNQARINLSLEDAVIEGDATQLHQLFQNLLTNAIKFQKEGVTPCIKIYSEQIILPDQNNKKFIRIYVEDNGIGFNEKYADRIFTIFQRLEGSKYPGSGIGLTICMKIAHYHGGDITVKSEPGKGTTFIITLPCKQERLVTEDFKTKLENHERQFDKIN